MPSRLLNRWRDAVALALVGLVPFGTYWRLWVAGRRAEYLYGDTCGLYWPDLVYLYRAFTHLQLPLWNPFERGGVSMLSEPEAGVLYPLNWLLVAIGAVSGGMPFVMIEVKACMHLAIGGVAMFALLRRRDSRRRLPPWAGSSTSSDRTRRATRTSRSYGPTPGCRS